MLLWPVAAAFIASLAAVIGSAAILALGPRAERAAVWLLAFAVGTLCGAATLHLLPEALEGNEARHVMPRFLGGILLFVVFERLIRWRHSHEDHGHEVTAQVLLWGDALHNLVDGLVLGVGFSTSTEVGIIASIAVFAHEIPQEIGDFAVLLGSGMARRRAFLLNYLSSATVIPGAIGGFLGSAAMQSATAWLLPVAAGGFVYIALADLVPSLHHQRGRTAAVLQIVLMFAGALVIYLTGTWLDHG